MAKRKTLLWISFFVAIFLIFIVSISFMTYKATVTVDGKVYSVEVAETSYLQEKGLSGRTSLKNDSGMLFVFKTPDKYGFWMKDMNFPLDIVWIGPDFKITHVEKSISPETYLENPPKIFHPEVDSQYVLEINAGQADLLNMQVGDTVKIMKSWL